MDFRTSIAAQSYAQARPATRPDIGAQAPAGGVGAALESFAATLRAGETTALSAMTGGADAQSLVQALSASRMAIETAVTVRDKVVEAYQEILRMPV